MGLLKKIKRIFRSAKEEAGPSVVGVRNRIIGDPGEAQVVIFGDDNEVVFEDQSVWRGEILIGTPDCPTSRNRVVIGKGAVDPKEHICGR